MSRREFIKNELKNYNNCKSQERNLQERLSFCEYQMVGVRSPNNEGVPVHQSSQSKNPEWYRLSEMKERLQAQLQLCRLNIRMVDDIVDRLPETDQNGINQKELVIDYFFRRKNIYAICRKHSLSYPHVYKVINRIVDNIER